MIRRNLLYQWTSTFYIALVSFGLTIALGRLLGPKEFGIYNYVLTIAAIYGVFLDGGYKNIIFRETASPSDSLRDRPVVRSALSHLLWAVAASVVLFFLPVYNKLAIGAALFCFSAIALVQFVSAHFRGGGSFGKDALWLSSVRTCTAICIFMAVLSGFTEPFYIFLAWFVGSLSALLFPWAKIVHQIPLRFPDRKLLITACSFIAIDLATLLYFRSDMVVLRYLGTSDDLGQYAAAYRVLEGVILLAVPVAQIWFRDLRLVRKKSDVFNKSVYTKVSIMFLCAVCVCFGAVFWGKYFINLAYGAEYVMAGNVLIYLMFSLIFVLPNTVLTQTLIAVNLEHYYAIIAFAAAIVNIALNIIFIPKYGPIAAACTTIATETFLLAGLGYCFFKLR